MTPAEVTPENDLEVIPAFPRGHIDDITHVVCCRNSDVSLCEKDVSESEWAEAGEQTDCRLCVFLSSTDYCPLGLECLWEED